VLRLAVPLAAAAALIAPAAMSATVEERVATYGPAARERMLPSFTRAGVAYPPKAVTLVGLKREERLEVYAGPSADALRFVLAYPVLAASGVLGPKLREGDLQVPEGVYRVPFLNPNSRFHLSLRVDYPNALDRANAERDARTDLGGDIMIHGNAVSIGCLAIGDPAIEEVFVLAADTGREQLRVVLSPVDLRSSPLPDGLAAAHRWAPGLYAQIRAALAALPAPPGSDGDGRPR
jgi:murein L,D-transpeptidase YafK